MPTENRSSNTEMVSVQATIESLEEAYAGDSALEFMNNAAQLLRQFMSISTLQYLGEPVGTLLIDEYFDGREVGDVDVQLDTKACEQLAEKYPGQSLPLYICPAPVVPGEVERLRGLINEWAGKWEKAISAGAVMEGERNTLRSKLAERDALLREWLELHRRRQQPVTLHERTEAALSASAEPSAPAAQPGKCLDGGDCGIGGTCKWCPHTTASPAQQPS